MKKKSFVSFFIPFSLVSLISIFGIFSDVMGDIDYKLYDAALQIKPLAPVSEKFLNIEVDDRTLDILNMYPLKRSTLADGMMVLKELGAKAIIVDTQMVDPTPKGINSAKMEQIPETISQAKNNTLSLTRQMVNAYVQGQLGGGPDAVEESEEYLADLEWEYDDIFDNLLYSTEQIALDFDNYIANSFRFMDNIYVTNDFEIGKMLEEDFITYLKINQSLKRIKLHHDPFYTREGYNPTIKPIMESTKGSGFVETHQDNDGKIRKTDLIYNKDGYYYPQLAFRYYLDYAGNPEINVYRNRIVLKGVKKEGKEPYDLSIPIENDGSMAINWAGKKYSETFDHELFYVLYLQDQGTQNLIKTIKKVIAHPITNRFTRGYNSILDLYNQAEKIKSEGNPDDFEEYIQLKEMFIAKSGEILNGTEESPSLDIQYRNAVNEQLNKYEFTEEEIIEINKGADAVTKIFEDGRENYNTMVDIRDKLKEKVDGSIVTFGYIATSTFDLGPNPFEGEYFNMGMYPTLINNFISEEFITLLPKWISVILAFIFVFIGARIIRKREAKKAIILGALLFMFTILLYLAIFITTGIYIYILIPGLSFILVFIEMISSKLITTSKDKAFIKHAFGQYLSEEVIKEIIDDPTKLKLGGEKAEITAIFTDVRGFSTISEKMTPDELVSLLNEYLTAMSDIALEHKGTIDKYEGDAIIGFFGAPTHYEDHATKAITAAIRMKQMEDKLNKEFLDSGKAPSPLLTRIGLNTGPCVVGNMGTPKKMDYTMMGNDVNIAARLEGVNKQYGTWILASENTIKRAEDIFLSRRLDRVRVVGINEPIRLYNPIALMDEATDQQIKMVETFEAALNVFELRKWEEAKKKFNNVLKIAPDDKPSVRYIKLCDKFIKKAPETNWDGVFNLTVK